MEQICNSVLLWFKSLFVLVPPHPKYLFNMKLLKTYFFGQASSSCPPTFLCVPISNLAWSSYKQYWTFHFLIGTNRWNFDLFQSASRHIAWKSLNINLACWTIQAGTSLLNPNLLEKMKLCSEIIYGCTVQAGENIFLMFIPLLRSLPDYNLRNSDFEKIVFYFFFKKIEGKSNRKQDGACMLYPLHKVFVGLLHRVLPHKISALNCFSGKLNECFQKFLLQMDSKFIVCIHLISLKAKVIFPWTCLSHL